MASITLKPFSRVSILIHPNPSFLTPSSFKITSNPQIKKPIFPQISSKSSPINPKSNHHLPKPLERFPFSCLGRSDHVPVGSPETEQNGVEYYRSGGIGIALLGNVGEGINPFLASLAANPTFVSWLLAWAIAQSMKMFLNFVVERKWNFRILFSSGGMPSSHSALCMALTTAVAIRDGTAGSLFAVCLAISLVVMYDAIGVRRHAGLHAEILNKIVEDLFQGHPISQRKLKVLLGHTPSQVIAGALLGILVACICCQGFIVAA